MIVVHAGFDGLDIALKASAEPALIHRLQTAKEQAAQNQTPTLVEHNGVQFHVADAGGKGGYTYRFDTGPNGAIWFFKKPKAGDPWGGRLSFHSQALAIKGLDGVRTDLYETCERLRLTIPPDGVSIGRVDYAVDILANDFVLEPTHFIMHARMGRQSFGDLSDMQTNGPSGRVTSITVGKQPGRQVIAYDKTEEVRKRNKLEWPLIWNENLSALGHDPIDFDAPDIPRVWRIELRMGKKALRDRTGVRGFQSLRWCLHGEMGRLTEDVNYHVPTSDTNRARWPLHPMWNLMQETISDTLLERFSDISVDVIRHVSLEQKQFEFLRTLSAHAVTMAVLEGCHPSQFAPYAAALPERMVEFLRKHPRDIEERFRASREKYADLLSVCVDRGEEHRTSGGMSSLERKKT